jgi:recombinational DNA repair ATPase RecF
MWIERITARSFGALRDQTLELGPGMNVVYGPNEAGKTTWHAAIRMALTGVRRGRGSATREASALEDQHRPWDDPDRWAVEARIRLADRRIDLVQDLLGKVACRATDVDLGVDVSAEITRPDGTPDASIWLGLDRDAFATTLSVGQGDMLAVADSAGALQEHMQRAAAAHGTDATAAGALERLREYRRRAVGADTAVAKGPLRTAMREAALRDDELADARRRHAAYLEHGAEAEAAAHALADAERRLALIRLAQAHSLASAARRRADRAAELGERYPAPPAQLGARDELADAVAGALAGWAARPTATRSTGRPSTAIEAELAAIPAAPTGDVSPAPAVVAALHELDLAEEAERAIHSAPAATKQTPPARPLGPIGLVAALGLFAAAAVVFVAGATLAALALSAGAFGLVAWWYLGSRPAGRTPGPPSRIAIDRDQGARARTTAARDALAATLRERGVEPGDDPRQACYGYQVACRDRAAAAAAASGADALRRELDSTRAAEQLAADAARAVADAEAGLRAVLAAADPDADPEAPIRDVAARLEGWQAARADETTQAERSIREYEELAGLLDGRTVADLAAEAVRVEERTASLVAAAGPGAAPLEGEEQAAVNEVERRRGAAASLAGAMDVREADLVDVAAAEELAIAAHGRIDAVSELASVIDETMALLEAAQRQVHRDLAPVLATAIREWLPTLSGGAYVEAGVNPADLSIEVKEAATGAWRQARLLSEGTREQIYLLLRLAMAQHLVTTPESAPMLLDEVTAQADADRRRAILDMLQALAAERQLVLFTHDDAVLDWAEDHLRGDNHRVIRLLASAGSSADASAGRSDAAPAVSVPIGSEV